MLSLLRDLAPLALGALLAWSGAVKLAGRAPERRVAGTALERLANGVERATVALRAVGAAELLVAAALLTAPAVAGPAGAVWSGTAAALLGAAFTGYLVHGRVTAPDSSCGCTARGDEPIGPRAFARAGLVVVGGAASAVAAGPWWETVWRHPVAATALLAGCGAVAAVLFADLDRRLLLALRRLRLRVFGHPLEGAPKVVPVEASVELLERSLAWEAAAPVVRSGLRDHWDEDGWRFLRYTGTHGTDRNARRVSVLFALDVHADLDTASRPAVRVAVLDEETGEPVTDALEDVTARTALPIVT
ncbi:MauE/DoxX family redox-associated membrane protein [Streptomyces megasporus]|uniref:MauE/DoxX family redox-associated membrane protein n=1 Tax=Streptomyces megasporus TaxID=44060 RepID=UPI0004E142D2|nr:MauE/DoxX family redox-associated membrane protein [Streptomyces megasporus]